MGKGRIITDHGEGLYTIELLEDRVRAEASRSLAVKRIASLDDRISDLEVELAAAQAKVDSAADAQDQAIAAYQIDPTDENRATMTSAGESVIQAAAKRDAIAGNIRALKTERLALQRRIDRIAALPALRQQQAWCADYTPELYGEVATAEVPGEVGQVLVRPGFVGNESDGWPAEIQGGATWAAVRDGAIQPALSGTPASVFYNLAMMPGWQRWRPTFRLATITAIDNDLCDITLDAATSSQQGLNVNAQASYTGVPIYYMECNGSVFAAGDRVLVAFSGNTEKPMVVGFEAEPRVCSVKIAFPVFIYAAANNYTAGGEPDTQECRPEFSGYERNVEATKYGLTQSGARIYRGVKSADLATAQSINDLGGYTSITGSEIKISEEINPATYTVQWWIRDGEGQCAIMDYAFPVTKVPLDHVNETVPGLDVNVSSFSETSLTVSLSVLESNDYAFPKVESTSYAQSPFTLSTSVSEVSSESLAATLADFGDQVIGQSSYQATKIARVLPGDEILVENSAFNYAFQGAEWIVVEYELAP